MSFERYPAYKDSGVAWLGEVPGHWMVAPLKRGFSVTLGKMLQPDSSGSDDELLPYLRAANIQWTGVEVSDIKQMWLSPRDRAQLTLQFGDLLVSEGGDVGRSCLWGDEIANCSFQNSVNRVRAIQGGSTRFLYYWMSTIKDKGYVDVLCNKSTIAHFTAEKVAAVPVPYPPPPEQIGIATFLDHETAKIDALVAEQEKLIALLQEKRQAVISHAVTQGLDPSVPMKDSGVEWLGEVPGHWEVAAVNYRYEVLLGKMLDEKRITGKHLAPYLRNMDVQWDRINTEDLPQMDFSGDDASRYCLTTGDLLVCEGGEVGRSAIWSDELDECYYQKALHRLRPRQPSQDVSRFQFYLFNMAATLGIFTGGEGKATIAHLTAETLRRYRFAYPPQDEQAEVVTFLDEKTTKIDALMSEARTAITLLQERRTALISAAVTGQIDVRAPAA